MQFKKPFNIIAVSERWISEERGTDVVLQGYELHSINRGNKVGGGVALFVDGGLTYTYLM